MNDFKRFESAAWERKAHAYDDTWGSVTSQSIMATINAAEIRPGTTLLDCGCGPGHLCHQASERGADVTGCDYSLEMIQIAKRTYPAINFCHGDAEALPFESSSFNAVILNYLLLHVSDQNAALLEARRVLKSDGRLVFTIWCPPTESPGLEVIFKALRDHADTAVIPPAQDIFMYASPERAIRFLSDNGFSDISTHVFNTVWQFQKPETFFNAIQAGTRMGGMIELQTNHVKNTIKASILDGIKPFHREDRFVIPTPSLIVSARKNSPTT